MEGALTTYFYEVDGEKKAAPGTRLFYYRCSLPGLADFIELPSPEAISAIPFEGYHGAEREGFEPSVPCDTHDFQSCTFGRSVISPGRCLCVETPRHQIF
jgi:hypothetical protein